MYHLHAKRSRVPWISATERYVLNVRIRDLAQLEFQVVENGRSLRKSSVDKLGCDGAPGLISFVHDEELTV
jgi:hypothetical protein